MYGLQWKENGEYKSIEFGANEVEFKKKIVELLERGIPESDIYIAIQNNGK